MNGLFFYIGLGIGLAAACGLRPFLPVLLAGALGSANALGVDFPAGSYHFLEAELVAARRRRHVRARVGSCSCCSSCPRSTTPWRASRRRDPLAAALAGLAYGAGAVLFAGTLAAHGDAPWAGALGGLAAVGLAQRVSGPVMWGARRRLTDTSAREALTLYLDGAALLVAALVCALHPLGYVVVAALLWLLLRRRSRAGEKYAGLRILGR